MFVALIVLLYAWAKSVNGYKKAMMQNRRNIFDENDIEESRPPSADEIASLSFPFVYTKPDPTIPKSQILPPPSAKP